MSMPVYFDSAHNFLQLQKCRAPLGSWQLADLALNIPGYPEKRSAKCNCTQIGISGGTALRCLVTLLIGPVILALGGTWSAIFSKSLKI